MPRVLRAAAAGALLLLFEGCAEAIPTACQTLFSAPNEVVSDGYVLRFVRAGPAAGGCESATPAETSDLWLFSTLAEGVVAAHSVAMPFTEGQPTPAGLVGNGAFARPQVDPQGFCDIPSLSTMTDDQSGTLFSYETQDLRFLGAPAYQGAEFEAKVTMTVGSCVAEYDVQALSPAVPCDDDSDCDPFRTPLSSGIPSGLDQGCTSEAWAAAVIDDLRAQGFSAQGICFPRQAFPSLKPGASTQGGLTARPASVR
jgi:hypothetical protein